MTKPHGPLYLSGPMTGIIANNYPVFDSAASALRAAGWGVVNPADLDRTYGSGSRTECMRRDIALLLDCQYIGMLPDWQSSSGAVLELNVAVSCGIIPVDATAPQDGVLNVRSHLHTEAAVVEWQRMVAESLGAVEEPFPLFAEQEA